MVGFIPTRVFKIVEIVETIISQKISRKINQKILDENTSFNFYNASH